MPSPRQLQHLVNVLGSYQENITPEYLEEFFIEVVKECVALCQAGEEAEIKDVLSDVDRDSLLDLILRNPKFSGQHISALMSLIIEGNEPDYICAAPFLITCISPMERSDGDLPVLAFLTALIPSLHPDYIVPRGFDLRQTLTLFMDHEPDPQTWRRYSDTLIQYFKRGALQTLSNKDSAREFLDFCTDPSQKMQDEWAEDQQTSTFTRERAIQLKKKLEELDAGTSS